MLKQICKRGHDTSQTGRDKTYHCKECRRLDYRAYKTRKRIPLSEKVNREWDSWKAKP